MDNYTIHDGDCKGFDLVGDQYSLMQCAFFCKILPRCLSFSYMPNAGGPPCWLKYKICQIESTIKHEPHPHTSLPEIGEAVEIQAPKQYVSYLLKILYINISLSELIIYILCYLYSIEIFINIFRLIKIIH